MAALLAGCGGGSGSSGTISEEYKIVLRADKVKLPVNIAGVRASSGADAPYTTVLHVNASVGGHAIPGGKDIFGCNVTAGLNVGSLYYLDGDPAHMVEVDDGKGGKVKVPGAYRSITLGSNAGGNSFHFHAGDATGVARITCSVQDPRDKMMKSAYVDIEVGGSPGAGATGLPASVLYEASFPKYLGTFGNLNNIRNNIAIQAQLKDELTQPVTDSTVPNLQVSIVSDGAAAVGARLISPDQAGTVIQTTTRGGIANFSLSSGASRGVILLLLTADRFDNNVANGIQHPISQLLAVPVVNAVATETLAMPEQSVAATCRKSTTQAMFATGGVPPYTWTALGSLPAGLDLSPSGIVSGVPESANGTAGGSYTVPVKVTDTEGASVTRNITFTIAAGECKPLAINAAAVALTPGVPFTYALSATGGTSPYKWGAVGTLPAGLSLSEAGVLSGTIGAPGTYLIAVQVTDSSGVAVTANLTITVANPSTTP
ncbi:Ig domain-containing protein [Ottowia testudinis]|uniref:Ig domain-containing protein n=1 Tax=Ottowia testudinis TaxID=2816950 RepID=A0A975CJV4_9BURK|nr:Ig domain-containing protein [Ottowia testudinis]QTD44773.1 putative Ig domain-containing protein [Ottowia testudinis]